MERVVNVKALVWDDHDRADVYSVQKSFGQGPRPFYLARGAQIIGWYDTADECKAAAQKDHEARVRAAVA